MHLESKNVNAIIVKRFWYQFDRYITIHLIQTNLNTKRYTTFLFKKFLKIQRKYNSIWLC